MSASGQNSDDVKTALLIIGGIIIIPKIARWIEDITGGDHTEETEEIIFNEDALTYPPANYALMADQLEEFFYTSMGEDEDGILGVLYKMRNDDDFAALVTAFGVRGYWWAMFDGTLVQHISQFTPELIPDINEHFARFGITYRL